MIFDVVGNKTDLFQREEVPENEARNFAKSINAGFHLVSCKDCVGIKDLFEDCGRKYLEDNDLTKEDSNKKNKNKIVLEEGKKREKKKCC
jgi:hypothetical protein